MRLLAVLFICVMVAYAADRCSPPLELAEFVNTLPADNGARRAAIEERLKQTPGDVTLHRMFVDSSVYERKPVRERYQRLLDSHPDSLDYQYLQARSLVGSDTRQALRIYARILEKDPAYPWVHLSQLEIYRAEAFRDRAKLAASFSIIQRVCPSSFQPYSYLNEIADDDTVARGVAKLRTLLKEANDVRELRLFATLWAVEFRVRPPAGHEEERKQVTEDLKRLLPFENDPRIRATIENGAKLTGDTILAQRLAGERKQDPRSVVMDQSNAWIHAHPRPKTGDSPEARHAWGKDLMERAEEWRKIAPGDVIGHFDRIQAMISLDVSPDEIGPAGDDFLALVRSKNGLMASWIVSLARVYMDGGVLLDRVPALCTEAMSRLDDPEAVIEIDLAPSPRLTASNRQEVVSRHVEALLVVAQTYEKQGDRDKAHAALWQASDYLASKAPAPGAADQQVSNWHTLSRYGILRASAEMAEREGRKLDALNGYREALIVRPIGREELLARQRKLWKELEGTDEGWQHWANPVSVGPSATATPGRPEDSAEKRKLPPLTARDIDGNQWTLDRFAGKTTIAVVWATWCEPCRAELPYFAKLAERLKSRNDVLAISFNTDDNMAVAQAFVKSQGYTFPVLSAKQYAEDLMPLFAIPRTWIINNGEIAKEYRGFAADGDKWVEEILSGLQ
jgi:thiol-disulfide isomerase/thioredoxin